jgi:uncharacterized protein with HEPN domain
MITTPLKRNGQIQLFGIRYSTKAKFTAQDGYDYPIDRGCVKIDTLYTLSLVKEIVKELNQRYPNYDFLQFLMEIVRRDDIAKPLLKIDLTFVDDIVKRVLSL